MRCAPGGQDQSKLLGLCNGREPPYLYVQTRPALGAAQRLEPAEETRKRQSDPRNGTTDRLALQSRRDVPEPARGRANASRASDAQPRDCCGGISAAAIGNIRRGTGHHGPSNGLRPESFRLALEIVRLFATQAAPQVLTFPARLQLFSCDSCVFAVHIWARGPIPWQACSGSRPFRVGTRHVPAAMHPRPFAGGDSHRSQGFLYPWKPSAPPHLSASFRVLNEPTRLRFEREKETTVRTSCRSVSKGTRQAARKSLLPTMGRHIRTTGLLAWGVCGGGVDPGRTAA